MTSSLPSEKPPKLVWTDITLDGRSREGRPRPVNAVELAKSDAMSPNMERPAPIAG